MRLEGVQLQLEVAQVPQRHRLVRRPRGQDELRVRVEAQAVDLGGVRVHRVRGLQGEGRIHIIIQNQTQFALTARTEQQAFNYVLS